METYPTSPLPAPSSRLPEILLVTSPSDKEGNETPERTAGTNIVFPFNSLILHRSRYFASIIPPGHNCPPHSVGSSWSRSWGFRRLEKSIEMVEGGFGAVEGTRSSGMERGRGSAMRSAELDVSGDISMSISGACEKLLH